MSSFYKHSALLGMLLGLAIVCPAPTWAQGLGLGLGIVGATPAKTYDHTLDSKLVQAVRAGKPDEVKSLLAKNADPNTKDTDKYTSPVLALAAGENYNPDILAAFLAAGADREITNAQGATPLILCSVDSHADSIKTLLKAGAKIEATTTDGLTALMVSASAGELDNVRCLLDSGANVNALSKTKGTALIYGCAKTIAGTGNIEVIKTLVTAGADVGVKAANDKNAMMTAQSYGLTDIANYLFEIDNRDNALFNAVAHAYNERKTPDSTAWQAVKTALDAGANPHYTIEDGRTSLMFLAYGIPGCDEATLKRFVDHSDINAQEAKFGATALHLAIENGNVPLVTLLLKAGARRDIATKTGKTAVDTAAISKNLDIIALFADPDAPDDDDDDNAIPYFV
ncbi:hypothetical protein EON83_27685 [bacterium]|nr:MAG: hypothetical protein EON83_27685 [bacterium]